MSLVELTEYLVKSITVEPDMVKVQQFDDEEVINIEVLVSKNDMKNIIGSHGRIINSIRTIVQASSRNNGRKRVIINVDSF